MSDKNTGKIVQVIGPVIDVEFGSDELPEIYSAITLDQGEGENHIKLTAEVQQHLGRNQVRAVAMSTTDGVVRGMEVVDTGGPISVPVGEETLGRIFNHIYNIAKIDNIGGSLRRVWREMRIPTSSINTKLSQLPHIVATTAAVIEERRALLY